MPEPKLERIFVEQQVIWRVSYLGMVRDFKTDWDAASFLYDLWQSHKKHNDLTQR